LGRGGGREQEKRYATAAWRRSGLERRLMWCKHYITSPPDCKLTNNFSLKEVVVVDGMWSGCTTTDHRDVHLVVKQVLPRGQK